MERARARKNGVSARFGGASALRARPWAFAHPSYPLSYVHGDELAPVWPPLGGRPFVGHMGWGEWFAGYTAPRLVPPPAPLKLNFLDSEKICLYTPASREQNPLKSIYRGLRLYNYVLEQHEKK